MTTPKSCRIRLSYHEIYEGIQQGYW